MLCYFCSFFRMKTIFQNTFHNTLKTLFIATTLSMHLFSDPLPALAADVLIAKDADIKPYQEVIKGFKQTCDCSVRELDLSDLAALERAVKARPDAVLAVGSQSFRKLRKFRTIPVIYTMVMPSETAYVNEENISGVSMDLAPETYLAAMTALFPDATRIGVLYDPAHTGTFVQKASDAASANGVSLILRKVRDPREVPVLLDELRGKVDVMWMLPDATLVNSETVDSLLLFSFQRSIPIFSFSNKYVKKGAVAALTIDPLEIGRQAGTMAKSLFQNSKEPQRAYAGSPCLSVNMNIGKKIGVRINDELVRSAEKIE